MEKKEITNSGRKTRGKFSKREAVTSDVIKISPAQRMKVSTSMAHGESGDNIDILTQKD